jgi:hypothetical protein
MWLRSPRRLLGHSECSLYTTIEYKSINNDINCSYMSFANRVSGSSETKTYGQDVALRAHAELRTLPRRHFFGKDSDERSQGFSALHVLISHADALFSGKLSYTAVARRCRASWTSGRIQTGTYGFAHQKTRGCSRSLISISWLSFLVDFRPEMVSERGTRITYVILTPAFATS